MTVTLSLSCSPDVGVHSIGAFPRTPSVGCGFPYHISSLLSGIRLATSLNPPTRSLSITGRWNVSLPSGVSPWNSIFRPRRRSKYNIRRERDRESGGLVLTYFQRKEIKTQKESYIEGRKIWAGRSAKKTFHSSSDK